MKKENRLLNASIIAMVFLGFGQLLMILVGKNLGMDFTGHRLSEEL